jgi:hypothetical protein
MKYPGTFIPFKPYTAPEGVGPGPGHTLPRLPLTVDQPMPVNPHEYLSGVSEVHPEGFNQALPFALTLPAGLVSGAEAMPYTSLPFFAKTLLVDNLSGYTLFCTNSNRVIPPTTVGWIVPLLPAVEAFRIMILSGAAGAAGVQNLYVTATDRWIDPAVSGAGTAATAGLSVSGSGTAPATGTALSGVWQSSYSTVTLRDTTNHFMYDTLAYGDIGVRTRMLLINNSHNQAVTVYLAYTSDAAMTMNGGGDFSHVFLTVPLPSGQNAYTIGLGGASTYGGGAITGVTGNTLDLTDTAERFQIVVGAAVAPTTGFMELIYRRQS